MTIKCFHCQKEVEPIITEKVFSNGTHHLEAKCSICKIFIKYLPQDKPITEVIMPFGKHKGEKILDISSEYLYWLLKNDVVKGNLKNQIESLFNI